jgi:hypothetical protein
MLCRQSVPGFIERSVADMVSAARTGVPPHANRAGRTIEFKGGPIDGRRHISRDATILAAPVVDLVSTHRREKKIVIWPRNRGF